MTSTEVWEGTDNSSEESMEKEPVSKKKKTKKNKKKRSRAERDKSSKAASKKKSRSAQDNAPLTKKQKMAKQRAVVKRRKKKWNLNTQEDQRNAIRKFIRSICGEGIVVKKEVLNQLNDMADYVCEELISKANVVKTSANEMQFSVKHVAAAIRSSDIPMMMKPVIFDTVTKAINKYNASRISDKEMGDDEPRRKKTTELRAGLYLKVSLVKNKVAKLVARGGLNGKPQVRITAAIAIVVAVECVLRRAICVANNYSTGGLKENANKVLSKIDVFRGIAFDNGSRNAKDSDNPMQYESGLAHYFTNAVFEKCGVIEDIPDRLKSVTPAPVVKKTKKTRDVSTDS